MNHDDDLDRAIYEFYRLVKQWVSEVECVRPRWTLLPPPGNFCSVGEELMKIIDRADKIDMIFTMFYKKPEKIVDYLFDKKED